MNLLDLGLIAALALSIGYGAKKGFVRQVMAVIGLVAAIVMAVFYNRTLTAELVAYFKEPTLWVAFLAYLLTAAILFALFKFLAKTFYRVAELQHLGRTDKFGGAIVGVLNGWFMGGFIVFLLMFIPMPDLMVSKIDESFFAPKMASSLPFIFEKTSKLHPSQPTFLVTVEDAVIAVSEERWKRAQSPTAKASAEREEERVYAFLDRLDRFFTPYNGQN